MTITLQWQHLILIFGFIAPMVLFWPSYLKSGRDTYGIGGLIVGAQTFITWLVALVIYLGIYYFGGFK